MSVNLYLALGALVIAIVIAIIFVVLYTRSSATLISPNQCPNFDLFTDNGLVAFPNRSIADPASDCDGSTTCTFVVSNLGEAKGKCDSLGSKCLSFSLTPISGSSDLTMRTSSTTAPSTNVITGTNFYKPFA